MCRIFISYRREDAQERRDRSGEAREARLRAEREKRDRQEAESLAEIRQLQAAGSLEIRHLRAHLQRFPGGMLATALAGEMTKRSMQDASISLNVGNAQVDVDLAEAYRAYLDREGEDAGEDGGDGDGAGGRRRRR